MSISLKQVIYKEKISSIFKVVYEFKTNKIYNRLLFSSLNDISLIFASSETMPNEYLHHLSCPSFAAIEYQMH